MTKFYIGRLALKHLTKSYPLWASPVEIPLGFSEILSERRKGTIGKALARGVIRVRYLWVNIAHYIHVNTDHHIGRGPGAYSYLITSQKQWENYYNAD